VFTPVLKHLMLMLQNTTVLNNPMYCIHYSI
jgi:hypothetical protein